MVTPPSDDAEQPYDLASFTRDQAKVNINVAMPRPVEVRLERLAALLPGAMRELGDVSETELVSVLIHTASEDAGILAEKVTAYRYARVHETIMSKRTEGTVAFEPRRRGRPRAGGSN